MARAGVLACIAVVGSSLAADVPRLSLLQRDDDLLAGFEDFAERGEELGVDVELEDMIEVMLEGRPKWRHGNKTQRSKSNLTASLDQIIPLLQTDFKKKTADLKRVLHNFKEKQKELDFAKKEATLAMKDLRKEAEKRRKVILDRKRAKEDERLAKLEAHRAAKEAMIKKAQMLMGAKQNDEMGGMMGEVTLGIMVEVMMALPKAVENPLFMKRINKAKVEIANTVQDFLNITRRKTAKFALASGRASDVELSFLMTRYFHEASFRVKAMQSDGMKIARDLNIVMPRELRQAFLPVVKGVRAQALPLRVNATSLASATITDACLQMSSLMSNISDYNNKLNTMHSSMHDVWQISELILPKVGKIYPMKPVVIDTVKDFMSMATSQVAGLQEAADEIVVNVGPIVAERMQCTWSAALPRSSMGWAALLLVLTGYLFA